MAFHLMAYHMAINLISILLCHSYMYAAVLNHSTADVTAAAAAALQHSLRGTFLLQAKFCTTFFYKYQYNLLCRFSRW